MSHKSHALEPSDASDPSSLSLDAPARFARFAAFTAFFAALRASFLASRALASPSDAFRDPPERASTSSSSSSSGPAEAPFSRLRAALQLFEQVVTSSQHLSHFLRHVNGRSHTTHTFVGRFSFFTPRIASFFDSFSLPPPRPLAVTQRLPPGTRAGSAAWRARGRPTTNALARNAAFTKRALASMGAGNSDERDRIKSRHTVNVARSKRSTARRPGTSSSVESSKFAS